MPDDGLSTGRNI